VNDQFKRRKLVAIDTESPGIYPVCKLECGHSIAVRWKESRRLTVNRSVMRCYECCRKARGPVVFSLPGGSK
jgi:hypothetical protein